MEFLSEENWVKLLAQIENLVTMRIVEIQNSAETINEEAPAAKIEALEVGFISDALDLALSKHEELIILIALLPNLKPAFFDNIIAKLFPSGADLTELGGVKGSNHRGFIPTGETALFLVSGADLAMRIKAMNYFNANHIFSRQNILWLESVKDGDPLLSGRIILNKEITEKILFGKVDRPRPGSDFPAKHVTTTLNWTDLVINRVTTQEIESINNWIEHHEKMINEWNLKNTFKAGYKALFYGPPGTGKTFTATLLGKHFYKDVYRVDLSQAVSKYIGETEKNLEKIFLKAEDKNWILFFDEADALFGKRTSVSSAHDRYANQETSYLLQRIEEFNGLVILASNNKSNIDLAFLRRFNAIVHFPGPDVDERFRLWKNYLPSNHQIKDDELLSIAKRHEVTGSIIVNSIQDAALKAFSAGRKIETHDLIGALKRELKKEDRVLE